MPDRYLERILRARVYDVAVETPLERADRLSSRIGNEVLLKREDLQPVFSFKLRGAYNKMSLLSPEERARGVVAASAGNHAQGLALSASKLGVRARIVMPTTTPAIKVDAVRSMGRPLGRTGRKSDTRPRVDASQGCGGGPNGSVALPAAKPLAPAGAGRYNPTVRRTKIVCGR